MTSAPHRPSVLVAIADARDRATISGIAVEMGYSTASVVTEEAATLTLERFNAGIVIVDLRSPHMDGLRLCERVRELSVDPCVVAALADEGAGDLPGALVGGVDDVLTRPLAPSPVSARLLVLERLWATRRAQRAAESEVARLGWLAQVGQTALSFQPDDDRPMTALYAHLEMLQLRHRLDAENAMAVDASLALAHRIEQLMDQMGSPTRSTADRAPRRATHPRIPAIDRSFQG